MNLLKINKNLLCIVTVKYAHIVSDDLFVWTTIITARITDIIEKLIFGLGDS